MFSNEPNKTVRVHLLKLSFLEILGTATKDKEREYMIQNMSDKVRSGASDKDSIEARILQGTNSNKL